MRKFPFDLHVGDIKQSLECAALELDSQRFAHRALRPVASDEIPRVDTLLLDACIDDRARYSLLVLRELFQFCLPTNVAPL